MKGMKRVVESAAVVCFAGALAITAVTSCTDVTRSGKETTDIASYEATEATEYDGFVSIEEKEVDIVTSSFEAADTEEAVEEVTMEKEEKEGLMSLDDLSNLEYASNLGMTEEEQEWKNSVMNKTKKELNVYKEADEKSAVVGKLRTTDVATVKQTIGEWTLIESGNLVGYVKSKNCVYGLEALEYANASCKTIATSKVRNLRVREKQSTDSDIVRNLQKGDTIEVDVDAKTKDGWIAVKCGKKSYYVSEEYVEVETELTTAMTLEEQKKAEAEEKKKSADGKYTYDSTITQGEATEYSVDDLTLLATIIDCEAGAESYDAQLGCGAVIMNRVKNGNYPNTIAGVVYQSGQFGPVSNGSLARKFRTGASESCYRAAKEALAGVDNTDGCLYFNGIMYTNRSGLRMGDTVFWKVW